MTPKKVQLYLIMLSTGYVTYDMFICFYELGYTMKKGGDFIIHHIVGIIGALAALTAGRAGVALSAGNLFSEWTTLPMNMRWRMLKHKQAEGLPFMAINGIFFISYVFVRVVFMGQLLIRNYQSW